MLTPVPLSVAGQQGSWGCRLLFRTAEADMGEEVSNGIGRLGLIDFTSHILLCPNHHWLRVKYVIPYVLLIIFIRKDSRETIFNSVLYWIVSFHLRFSGFGSIKRSVRHNFFKRIPVKPLNEPTNVLSKMEMHRSTRCNLLSSDKIYPTFDKYLSLKLFLHPK